MQALAIANYKGRNPSEASFNKGELFEIKPYDEHWAESNKGLVPLNRIVIENKIFKSFKDISIYFILKQKNVIFLFINFHIK